MSGYQSSEASEDVDASGTDDDFAAADNAAASQAAANVPPYPFMDQPPSPFGNFFGNVFPGPLPALQTAPPVVPTALQTVQSTFDFLASIPAPHGHATANAAPAMPSLQILRHYHPDVWTFNCATHDVPRDDSAKTLYVAALVQSMRMSHRVQSHAVIRHMQVVAVEIIVSRCYPIRM